MCCNVSLLYAHRPPHRNGRLLRVADEQTEVSTLLLALAHQLLVIPDTLRQVAVLQRHRLIASGIPPAAHLGHHVRDPLITLARRVVQQVAKAHVLVLSPIEPIAAASNAPRGRHTNNAAVEVLESSATEQLLDVVCDWLEADAGVDDLHLHLQLPDSTPSFVAHVDHVQVEHADLQIPARAEDTLALVDCGTVCGLGRGDGEAEDNRSEEAAREREISCKVWVVDMTMVGKSLQLIGFAVLGKLIRVWIEVVDGGIRVGQGDIVRPI